MDPLKERELIRLYIEGSEDASNAIGLLFKEYYRDLLLYSFRFTQDQMVSEDIVANLFEKLLVFSLAERSRRFDKFFTIKSYLFVLCKNASLDFIREKNRRGSIVSSIATFFTSTVYQHDTSDFITKDTADKLFDLLTKREKEILLLHLAGFNNHEIGEKLSISHITARNLLHLGKSKLRKQWNSLVCILFIFFIY